MTAIDPFCSSAKPEFQEQVWTVGQTRHELQTVQPRNFQGHDIGSCNAMTKHGEIMRNPVAKLKSRTKYVAMKLEVSGRQTRTTKADRDSNFIQIFNSNGH